MHRRLVFARAVSCLAAVGLVVGCQREADPRPQLVVVVDTDLPAPGQLLDDPTLSPAAVADTLRIDVLPLAGTGEPSSFRTFLVDDASSWPLSFGVAISEVARAGTIRLRLRLFRGSLATPGKLGADATLDPPPEVTVDRLVQLPAPASGITYLRVSLRGACLGLRSSSGSTYAAASTCLDADRPSVAPTEGVTVAGDGTLGASEVGTFAAAHEVPCPAAGTDDAPCIPGGFTVLGDAAFQGIAEAGFRLDSWPLRPVVLSPFYMDRHEVTVRDLRALIAAGYGGPLPNPKGMAIGELDATKAAYCTWQPVDDGTSADLPINCVEQPTAVAICKARGGDLPSEAQWEHAARGRGEGSLWPWGDDLPGCCRLSAGRPGTTDVPACTEMGSGPEPVGSHPGTATCGGDVTRDGILDMAGSVRELVRDSWVGYDQPCWAGGVLVDHVCTVAYTSFTGRGGSWPDGLGVTSAVLRASFTNDSVTDGFRCVYPGPKP